MRPRGLLLLVLVAGCGANAAVLTDEQATYLQGHPELGPKVRNALLYRTIEVGDSLERVVIAWDGLLFRPKPPRHKPGDPMPKMTDPVETFEVFVPVDGRPVVVRQGAYEEQIPRGRVLLTFKDRVLAGYVRIE